jgi:hypothetical protein
MRFLPLALLSVPALLAVAAPARADEVDVGLRFGDRRGAVAVGLHFGDARPAPVVVRAPYRHADERLVTIPAHEVVRLEEVRDPAVYSTRRVPVYEDRRVPVYETVETPVFDFRYDSKRGGRFRVRVGERRELRLVGERVERVQVGERLERFLVRAETVRMVERREWIAARTVLVVDGPHRHRHPGLEVMTVAEYEREMASIVGRHDGVRRRVARAG